MGITKEKKRPVKNCQDPPQKVSVNKSAETVTLADDETSANRVFIQGEVTLHLFFHSKRQTIGDIFTGTQKRFRTRIPDDLLMHRSCWDFTR